MLPESDLKDLPHPSKVYHPVSSSVILIILLICGLAPVLIPLEIAKWYIAAAQNSFRKGDLDRSDSLLDSAKSISTTASELADYYLLRVKLLAKRGHPDESLRFLDSLASEGKASAAKEVGVRMSDEFFVERDFKRSLDALKLAMKLEKTPSVTHLNMIAYLRALNNVDLVEALKAIDAALALVPNEPSLLDTKAWVLFQSGRSKEALPLMEKSLTMTSELHQGRGEFIGKDPVELEKLTASLEDEATPELKEILNQVATAKNEYELRLQSVRKEFGDTQFRRWLSTQPLHQVAVMRFHYARILEALGEFEKSDLQWGWLNYYGLTDEELLY